jgi:hypothetical protein
VVDAARGVDAPEITIRADGNLLGATRDGVPARTVPLVDATGGVDTSNVLGRANGQVGAVSIDLNPSRTKNEKE